MGSYTSPPWGWIIYLNYLEFFFLGDLSILPHLFVQSFIYINMDSWMFIFWGYNPILFYFISQIVTILAIWSFFQLASMSLWQDLIILKFLFLFLALSNFLALQGAPTSSFIFSTQILESICSNMDGPRNYHIKWSKSEKETQILYDTTYMWNLKYDTNELIYETETDSQI